MSDPLNQYGDTFTPTDDGHGVDIASQRQDELDLASLAFIREQVDAGKKIQAVDLGGGYGAHSIRMAEAGFSDIKVSRSAFGNIKATARKL